MQEALSPIPPEEIEKQKETLSNDERELVSETTSAEEEIAKQLEQNDITVINEAVERNPELTDEIINTVIEQADQIATKQQPESPFVGVMSKLLKSKMARTIALVSSLFIASSFIARKNERIMDAFQKTGVKITDILKQGGEKLTKTLEDVGEKVKPYFEKKEYQPHHPGAIVIPSFFMPIEYRGLDYLKAEEIDNSKFEIRDTQGVGEEEMHRVNYRRLLEWQQKHPEITKVIVEEVDGKIIVKTAEYYAAKGNCEIDLKLKDGKSLRLTGEKIVEKPFEDIDKMTLKLEGKVRKLFGGEEKFTINDWAMGELDAVAAEAAIKDAVKKYEQMAQK